MSDRTVFRPLTQDGVPVKAPPGHIIDDTGTVRKVLMSSACGDWPTDEMLATDVRDSTVMWVANPEQAAREAAGGKHGK